MPPRRDASASESESRRPHSSAPKQTKSRSNITQQVQREFVAKYVNSNGPNDRILPDPLDFNEYPTSNLRNYARKLIKNEQIPDCKTVFGSMLESKIGEESFSYKKNHAPNTYRISKPQLASIVHQHFVSHLPVKESDTITNFIYKVKNQDKSFKLNIT
ncbi:BA75_00261T0 [Komagataella pastoris]|uniref:BA75_00261T0 n=1 Tax=Komagataella pastoris TaxID=4922 RepID=A0A1B2J8Z5_PICPA|nr:BA75_00261T0 [Komagataella pastoris]